MDYTDAKLIADELLSQIKNYCEVANISGSIRRKVPEPGDIEIMAIPLMTMREDRNLFGEIEHTAKEIHPEFEKIVTGWGKVLKGQPSGRHMQIEIQRTVGSMDWLMIIDLFMPQPHDYYRQYAIRTGSVTYSKKLANQWVKKGYRGTPDGLRKQTECYAVGDKWFVQKEYRNKPSGVPTWKSEEDFFRWIGVHWVVPENRNL